MSWLVCGRRINPAQGQTSPIDGASGSSLVIHHQAVVVRRDILLASDLCQQTLTCHQYAHRLPITTHSSYGFISAICVTDFSINSVKVGKSMSSNFLM